MGLDDHDYEWVTAAIVQVANVHCPGRIVSVLEGGYRIQGGLVSAFARSAAAHVGALTDTTSQVRCPLPWPPSSVALGLRCVALRGVYAAGQDCEIGSVCDPSGSSCSQMNRAEPHVDHAEPVFRKMAVL